MRKCKDCGATKGLKSGWTDDEDGFGSCSFCKKCFFDNEYDIEHEDIITKENWDNYDYYWKLKKGLQNRKDERQINEDWRVIECEKCGSGGSVDVFEVDKIECSNCGNLQDVQKKGLQNNTRGM